MRLALDAMGGDLAPEAPVAGALSFARANPDVEIVLVGDEPRLASLLGRVRPENLFVRHAPDAVGMEESPTAIRRRPESSLAICFSLVKSGEADAVVSAGHSGALMAAALLLLGRLGGVERPAIAALLPALQGNRCLLLDAGANVDCKPTWLAQFGVLGEAYMRKVQRVARPRVAVLSNGSEPSKGTELTRAASALLARSGLDFRGYVEGQDLFTGSVDVVVTDGFSGNLVLKTAEGTALGVAGLLRHAIQRNGVAEKLGGLLLKPALAGLRRVVDSAEVGGAPLLGVDGVAVVAHGGSSARAIENALRRAQATVEAGLQADLLDALRRSEAWLPPRGKGATAHHV